MVFKVKGVIITLEEIEDGTFSVCLCAKSGDIKKGLLSIFLFLRTLIKRL